MTNVKSGDTATVTNARNPENVGIEVTVLRPAKETASGKMWWVDVGEPRPGMWNGVKGIFSEFIIPAAWLKAAKEAKDEQ